MSKTWGTFFGILGLAGLLASAPSCHRSRPGNETDGARATLQAYVTKSFAVKSLEERAGLEELLAGVAKQRMSAWSDEQFLNAFVDKRRRFERLLVKEVKAVGANEVVITYELTFTDVSDPKTPARSTAKKIATLIKDESGDSWRIREVRNLKLLIEYENELSLP